MASNKLYKKNDVLLSDKGNRYLVFKVEYDRIEDGGSKCFCFSTKKVTKTVYVTDLVKRKYTKSNDSKRILLHIFSRNDRGTLVYASSSEKYPDDRFQYDYGRWYSADHQALVENTGEFIRGKAIDLDDPSAPPYQESAKSGSAPSY